MAQYRVLIIEDDPVSARLYTDIMTDHGFVVEHAACVNEAFKRLVCLTPPIEIAILDLLLPNGQGLDVLRTFNARFPAVPLVVVTGMSIEHEKAIEAGAESLLIKGEFTSDMLVRCVSEAIPRHRVRWQFKPLEDEANYLAASMKSTDHQLARLEKTISDRVDDGASPRN